MKRKIAYSSLVIIIILLALYISTYLYVSRTSYKICKPLGIDGFYYVICDPATFASDKSLEDRHVSRARLFYPIWFIDHKYFGGPEVESIPLAGMYETK